MEHLLTSLSDFLGVDLLCLFLLAGTGIGTAHFVVVHALAAIPNALEHVVVVDGFSVPDGLALAERSFLVLKGGR